MQNSMTGYGRNDRKSNKFLIRSEVKTLNSKFLDFSPRLPKELNSMENIIRGLVNDQLKRGKVMLSIELELAKDEALDVQVDEKLFKAYHQKFKALSSSVKDHSDDLVSLALQAPEVIKQQELSEDEIPWEDVKASVESSIQDCMLFRKKEGQALADKLNDYIHQILSGLARVDASDKTRDENLRQKIQKSLDDISDKVKVDQNRFEQELIFYLERLDISEEKVRLKQHLNYFLEILENEENAGKKLGFIAQEIGREINTIGSKANDAAIQRTVVEMKDELEKIKEQVLNLI